MTRLTIRIDFAGAGRLGPGKVALLEAVGATGSISAAARALGMSYRRAWLLLEQTNALFTTPVTATAHGGQSGGGAILTDFGRLVVERYRAIEHAAERATRDDVQFLESRVPGA